MHKIKGSCQEQWLFAEATWLYLINDFTSPTPNPPWLSNVVYQIILLLNKTIFILLL